MDIGVFTINLLVGMFLGALISLYATEVKSWQVKTLVKVLLATTASVMFYVGVERRYPHMNLWLELFIAGCLFWAIIKIENEIK